MARCLWRTEGWGTAMLSGCVPALRSGTLLCLGIAALSCCESAAATDAGASVRSDKKALRGILDLPLTEQCPRCHRLAAGLGHTCALRDDGTVWCWGRNSGGQALPTRVNGIDGAVAITAGFEHSCALRRDGTVWCWGSNRFGQLGESNRPDPGTPAPVPGLTDAVAVAAGMVQTCAARQGGELQCWGRPPHSEAAGPAMYNPLETPQPVKVRAIAVSMNGACAVTEPAAVYCCNFSTLGSRNPANLRSIEPLDDPIQVAVGQGGGCALLASGRVSCWGSGFLGPLGASTDAASQKPSQVRGVLGAKAVGVGERHACAVVEDGRVLCWGGNPDGQRGDPSQGHDIALVSQRGFSKAVDVVVGHRHSCALLAAGHVRCWGDSHDGKLGGEPAAFGRSVAVCASGRWDGTACADGELFALGGGAR
ncbi:MAG: hypothetical protein JXR83_01395 [Deltaproteobacteria bacterium]|nr:hypothetical protein [Deltaproteobacteria bacterium]